MARLSRALLLIALMLAGVSGALAQPAAILAEGRPVALVADVRGAIGPATTRFIQQAIEQARDRSASVLVLRIDTPGGLVISTREIISAILASPVPVAGYVFPPGGQAASAGTYIMYATHVAAMAPGTNMGAATPVQMGGVPGLPRQPQTPDKEDGEQKPAGPQTAAESKAVEDAVAFIRSLAELRGRNVEWAEKAVREAASVSADQALALQIIDLKASDLDELLKAMDGRTVTVAGQPRTLATANALPQQFEPGAVTRILGVLTNPNIAFILMLVGIYGLIFELASPGSFGPGVVGVICLILGLYSLNQLPIDYAGLLLIIAGIVFMVLEALTPTFGILGIGGLISFIIGSAMLIDTDIPEFQISWSVIAGAAVASGLLLVFGLAYAWKSQRRPVTAGLLNMRGATGEVIDWSGAEGHVFIAGERWHAKSEDGLEPGARIRVSSVDGLTLLVKRAT